MNKQDFINILDRKKNFLLQQIDGMKSMDNDKRLAVKLWLMTLSAEIKKELENG